LLSFASLPCLLVEREPIGDELQVALGPANCAFAEAPSELGAAVSADILADSLGDKAASVAFRCDTVNQTNRLFGESDCSAVDAWPLAPLVVDNDAG
jgi:hypothetical protein